MYLKYLKKDLNAKGRPFLKNLESEISKMGVLPLYENMELSKTNKIIETVEFYLENLKKSKKVAKNLNSFFYQNYFRIYFINLHTKYLETIYFYKSTFFD